MLKSKLEFWINIESSNLTYLAEQRESTPFSVAEGETTTENGLGDGTATETETGGGSIQARRSCIHLANITPGIEVSLESAEGTSPSTEDDYNNVAVIISSTFSALF